MARNKTAQGGISLRRKVTAWLAAILLVTMLSTGIATMAGQWTVRSFDTLLADNAVCYTVQNALKDEAQAFARYVRQPTSETEQAYTAACTASEQSLAALPLDYARIGEERYARTWNLLQGYAGYRQERDAFLQLSPSADTYIGQMYHVMALQDYLAEYALRLTQATLEQENALYSSTAAHIRHLPWLYLGLFLTAAALMLLLIRVLSRAVVRPLLRLAQASRSIAEGDLSSPDLPVKSSDEVGRLTGTFNQMKHAMAQQLTTQQALHREEVRNLALEKDLEHTRLEVLKSQVNPHFLFNTLNMISCMARLEDASTTDQMIVHLGSLFRHNLRTKRQQITLEEELDGLEDYIYLQQMRFDGRITVEKKHPGAACGGFGAVLYAAAGGGKRLLAWAQVLRGRRTHPAASMDAGQGAGAHGRGQRRGNDPRGTGRCASKTCAERADRTQHWPWQYFPPHRDAVSGRKNADIQPRRSRYCGAV